MVVVGIVEIRVKSTKVHYVLYPIKVDIRDL